MCYIIISSLRHFTLYSLTHQGDFEMTNITMKSTLRGFSSSSVNSGLWLLFNILLIALIGMFYIHEYDTYQIASNNNRYHTIPLVHFMGLVVVSVVGIFTIIFTFSHFSDFTHSFIYGPKQIFKIQQGEKNTLTIEDWSFPMTRSVEEILFERIIGIEIYQSIIDRWVNSGVLVIQLVIYTNADSVERSIVIDGIENPNEAKKKIEGLLSHQNGFGVRILPST